MRARVFSSGFALILLLAGGCSLGSANGWASKEESEADEVARLKRQIVELERRAVMAEVDAGRLERRLAELEAEARPTARAGGGSESDSSSVDRPPGPALETLPAVPETVEVSELPEPAPPAPTVDPPESAPDLVTTTTDSSETLTADAQALYDRGYTLFHQGRYVDSETAFQQFLQRFGSTVLGDNALFWIAEARYTRGDTEGAIAAYQETVSRFPDGNKAPDAGLKIGDCLRDLGDSEGARRSYRQVIDDYPKSSAAAIARERLAE